MKDLAFAICLEYQMPHYLIPIQVAKKGRFKKKGNKLHVYMDHIFVAQHMKL